MTRPVTRGEDAKPQTIGPGARFIGDVVLNAVSDSLATEEIRVAHVRFAPGARSRPHLHRYDQLLYFLQCGIVAVDGGPDQRIEAGEYVLIPANVVHMHGATADAPGEHVSMQRAVDSDFDCPIPEAWGRYAAG